jgi:hypothetical protein
MYLTSSQISHVAMYVGEGHVLDATLEGSQISPINSLFSAGTRIVVCRLPIPPERRASLQSFTKYVGIPYGYKDAYCKGLRILLARDWPYFRWRFFVDTAVLLIAADLPFIMLLRTPIFSWLVIVHFGLIAFHRWLWPRKPFPPDAAHGKPADAVQWMLVSEAAFYLIPSPHSSAGVTLRSSKPRIRLPDDDRFAPFSSPPRPPQARFIRRPALPSFR